MHRRSSDLGILGSEEDPWRVLLDEMGRETYV